MAEYPEKQFFQTLKEFTQSLQNAFPEHEGIQSIKIKRNTKSIHTIVALLEPHADAIRDTDDTLFNAKDIYLLPDIDFHDIWKKQDLSIATKKAIWQFLQMLLLLGKFIIKPQESMQNSGITNLVKAVEQGAKKIATDQTSIPASSSSPPIDQDAPKDSPGMIEGLVNDLMGDIKIPENVDSTNPMQVFQSLLSNNGNGLSDMIGKISGKFSQKLESGQLNEQVLMKEVQDMFKQMSAASKNDPNIPDMSKVFDPLMKMTQGGQPPNPKDMMQTIASLVGTMSGGSASSSTPNMMGMLSDLMGNNGEELPDLDELQSKIRKEMRHKYRSDSESSRSDVQRQMLRNKLKARHMQIKDVDHK